MPRDHSTRFEHKASRCSATAWESWPWEPIKLLTVQVDRLRQWYKPGLLCIEDAAHAMSPVGGVGINLAIQDAVASANLLAQPLRDGRVTEADLAKVEARAVCGLPS